MRWNVIRGGRVVGELEADEHGDAQRAAVELHGLGARVSAPADPNAAGPPRRPSSRAEVSPRATVGAWRGSPQDTSE